MYAYNQQKIVVMAAANKGNQKLFSKILKGLWETEQEPNTTGKDKQGSIIADEGAIIQRWKEYFEELRKNNTSVNRITEPETSNAISIEAIAIQEVERLAKKLKRGKAPGHNMVTTEKFG